MCSSVCGEHILARADCDFEELSAMFGLPFGAHILADDGLCGCREGMCFRLPLFDSRYCGGLFVQLDIYPFVARLSVGLVVIFLPRSLPSLTKLLDLCTDICCKESRDPTPPCQLECN